MPLPRDREVVTRHAYLFVYVRHNPDDPEFMLRVIQQAKMMDHVSIHRVTALRT